MPENQWDKADAWAKGSFLSLKDDGDTFAGVVCGGPAFHQGTGFDGKPTIRLAVPFLPVDAERSDQAVVFPMGKKAARAFLAAFNRKVLSQVMTITRHGKRRSTETFYTFQTEPIRSELQAELDSVLGDVGGTLDAGTLLGEEPDDDDEGS